MATTITVALHTARPCAQDEHRVSDVAVTVSPFDATTPRACREAIDTLDDHGVVFPEHEGPAVTVTWLSCQAGGVFVAIPLDGVELYDGVWFTRPARRSPEKTYPRAPAPPRVRLWDAMNTARDVGEPLAAIGLERAYRARYGSYPPWTSEARAVDDAAEKSTP